MTRGSGSKAPFCEDTVLKMCLFRRDCDPFRGATVQTNAGRKWEIVVGAGGTPEPIERPRALLTEELASD